MAVPQRQRGTRCGARLPGLLDNRLAACRADGTSFRVALEDRLFVLVILNIRIPVKRRIEYLVVRWSETGGLWLVSGVYRRISSRVPSRGVAEDCNRGPGSSGWTAWRRCESKSWSARDAESGRNIEESGTSNVTASVGYPCVWPLRVASDQMLLRSLYTALMSRGIVPEWDYNCGRAQAVLLSVGSRWVDAIIQASAVSGVWPGELRRFAGNLHSPD